MRETLATPLATRIVCALLAIALPAASFAGMVRLDGEMNGRSSADFVGTRNVLARVPRGTEGHVLERFKLPSGNYGIRMEITSLGAGKAKHLKVGDKIWVYYHEKTPSLRRLELYDDQKKLVQSAVEGAWAKTSEPFSVAALAADGNCETCGANSTQGDGTDPLRQDQKDAVDDISDTLDSTDEGGTLDFDREEVLAYLTSVRPGHAKDNARIADALMKECAKPKYRKIGVKVTDLLALMRAESEMNPNATSYKSRQIKRNGKWVWVKDKSRPIAKGLLQLTPATMRSLGGNTSRIYDIETNIEYGVKFYADQLQRFGTVELASIAYNAGPGRALAVKQGRLEFKHLPKETQGYVAKVDRLRATYTAFVAKRESRNPETVAST